MTCREVIEVVTEYLEGAMPAEDRRRFEAHVADCDDCATYLAQMRLTIATIGELRTESLPPRTREALVEGFRDWKESR